MVRRIVDQNIAQDNIPAGVAAALSAAQAAQAGAEAAQAAALAAAAAPIPAAAQAPAGGNNAAAPNIADLIAAINNNVNQRPEHPNQTNQIMNPKDADLRKLNEIENTIEFKSWFDDVKDKAEIRAVWQILQNQLAVIPQPENLTPYQTQMLTVLKAGIKSSLGTQLRVELQPQLDASLVPDTASGIIRWLRSKLTVMQTAMEKKSLTEFRQMKWKGTKISIAAWHAKLKMIGGNCGRSMQTGYALDFAIREKLIKNVGDQSLDIAHLVRDFKRHTHETVGFTNDDLVKSLMVQMLADDTCGEKQCQTYAANITEDGDKPQPQAMKQNNRNKNRGGNKETTGDDASTYYQNNWNPQHKGGKKGEGKKGGKKGKGKGKNKSGKSNVQKSNDKTWPKTWTDIHCNHCYRHYKPLGMLDEKWKVIKSHNSDQCQFSVGSTPSSSSSSAPAPQPKAKGGGKQKGKGKGGGNQRFDWWGNPY